MEPTLATIADIVNSEYYKAAVDTNTNLMEQAKSLLETTMSTISSNEQLQKDMQQMMAQVAAAAQPVEPNPPAPLAVSDPGNESTTITYDQGSKSPAAN
jgi:hypothetical protein